MKRLISIKGGSHVFAIWYISGFGEHFVTSEKCKTKAYDNIFVTSDKDKRLNQIYNAEVISVVHHTNNML